MKPFQTLQRFWLGLCTNWAGTMGVVLTTTGFVLFVIAELLRLTGVVTNAYAGLLTYLALPAIYVIGLLLIPFGWWRYRRKTGLTTRELLGKRFDPDLVKAGQTGSRIIKTIAILTLVNVIFLSAGGARMLSFMDGPEFCGTACHSVMGPEWATYQSSPHARVRCVDCHVGQGTEAAIDAKLNGIWQMISVTFDLHERPIPTPVHNLRPARETCERCHWPDAFYGDRIKRIVHYDARARDSKPRYTTLSLKVGSGSSGGRARRGSEIHWHVSPQNEVRYRATDHSRTEIAWVEVKQRDGTYRRFSRQGIVSASSAERRKDVRVLDCVDCHNRATHIYQEPEEAVDRMIATGEIDRALPFAKRQALGALTGEYKDGEGPARIDSSFRGYYRRSHRLLTINKAEAIDRAVEALQRSYRRNIHPEMKIRWNSYPDHLGHRRGPGCRRCHRPEMVDDRGQAVRHDCTLCHSLLAYESERPFAFIEPPDPRDPECRMAQYHGREFRGAKSAAPTGEDDPCRARIEAASQPARRPARAPAKAPAPGDRRHPVPRVD